jgi:hypothetical protein
MSMMLETAKMVVRLRRAGTLHHALHHALHATVETGAFTHIFCQLIFLLL